MEITISTEKRLLNIDLIHKFLTQSYWAKGRTKQEVGRSVEHSICFGVYLGGHQIGFARVITDKIIFSYLMDVFILEKYRGNGYSKELLTEIFNHPDLKNVKKWWLGTLDAHGLYEQFGFHAPIAPERWMERNKNT